MNRGSSWRKWDLHVHTPATVLANEYGSWDGFLKTLEGEGEVCVIGVADYLSIEGYKRLVSERKQRSFGSIQLLIPNIEFRLTPQTHKGNAINLHLLIDPSPRRLRRGGSRIRPSADFRSNTSRKLNSCTPSEIMRLGCAFNPNALNDSSTEAGGRNEPIQGRLRSLHGMAQLGDQ